MREVVSTCKGVHAVTEVMGIVAIGACGKLGQGLFGGQVAGDVTRVVRVRTAVN